MNLEVLSLHKYTEHDLSGTAFGLTKIEQGRAIRRFGLADKQIILKHKVIVWKSKPSCAK